MSDQDTQQGPGPATPEAELRPARQAGRVAAAVSGIVGVAVALGVGELLAAILSGVPSPVTAIGGMVIPYIPPALEDWAISTFGTSDKAVLAGGIVVTALAIGSYVGIRSRLRHSVAAMWFVVVGLLALVASLSQPLVSPPQVVVALALVVAAGTATVHGLLTVAERDPASGDDTSRRTFVQSAAGAALGAVAATWVGRRVLAPEPGPVGTPLTLPSPSDGGVGAVPEAGSFDAIDGLERIVVSNDDFYRIDTALSVPRIDAESWRLRIHGLVDREIELTYRDILDRDLVERYVTIACVSNEVGDDLVGNAAWLGLPLADLLDEAGLQSDAGQVVGRAVDGWTAGFPTDVAMDGRDALLAVGMNGEPLPLEHGYPARLIVPGLYGYVSATKWITELELTTWDGFDAYWVPRGWAKRGPIKTQSRIDVPRSDTRIEPGALTVAGVAWAPTRGISAVEVQVDEGEWQEAEVSEPLSDDAWVQWRIELDLPEGVSFLRVRATDGEGTTQTDEVAPPRPDGATGWHTIRVFT